MHKITLKQQGYVGTITHLISKIYYTDRYTRIIIQIIDRYQVSKISFTSHELSKFLSILQTTLE
jgi:hypothetical protein